MKNDGNDEEVKDMNVEGMTFSANDVTDNSKPGGMSVFIHMFLSFYEFLCK